MKPKTRSEHLCIWCRKDISDRGHSARFCLECYKKRENEVSARWRRDNHDKYLECHRNSQKKGRAKYRAYNHKWSIEHREERRLNLKKNRALHKELHLATQRAYEKKPEVHSKQLARYATRRKRKRTGICDKCKVAGKTEFHHLTYYPNTVVELCILCHNREHKRMIE